MLARASPVTAHQPVVEAEEIEPSPPTASCTMRVLAAFGSNPSSASKTRSRASAASACSRVTHITTTSSA